MFVQFVLQLQTDVPLMEAWADQYSGAADAAACNQPHDPDPVLDAAGIELVLYSSAS